ncbi:MAG: arylamine N-acetyltransferase family protein [Gaiella sp.]
MDLGGYLARIGLDVDPRPDLDTLRALHRGHVEHIPYENLDVQLGVPVTRDPEAIFDKLVTRRRGDWCYEMNGLLAWALEEVGFTVTRVSAGVGRSDRGTSAVGNHLVLLVDLETRYLADVGFGEGLIEPLPLFEGTAVQRGLTFRLERLTDDWWRFHSHPLSGAADFDFCESPADENLLDEKCLWLQTDPESSFVLNAVAQRHLPDELNVLRGKTLRRVRGTDVETRTLATAAEYLETLLDVFGLDLPAAAALWPRIEARHTELFGDEV